MGTRRGSREDWRHRVLLPVPADGLDRVATAGARLTAAALLVGIGVIHLALAPTYALAAGYVGALFYVTCGAAWLAAAAILAGVRGAWAMGAATALGAAVGLLLSTTVGLPGFTDSLSASYATLSLALEAGVVTLFLLCAVARRSLLLSVRPRAGQPSAR